MIYYKIIILQLATMDFLPLRRNGTLQTGQLDVAFIELKIHDLQNAKIERGKIQLMKDSRTRLVIKTKNKTHLQNT